VKISGEIVISRPVEQVFDFVADERNEPQFNAQLRRVEKISDGPVNSGTRFQAETGRMGRTVERPSGYEELDKRPSRPFEVAGVGLSSAAIPSGVVESTECS
jgi:hypothetical protein